uniref:Protein TIC 214 n=1 Tax=Hymenophyllum holochilum TaxID=2137820 RepID=A0A385KP43_9MONI
MLLYLLQVSFITWVRVAGPCILFGLYYGLLSTLPIGPSQILSIRAFLLGGNTSGSAALSGLMVSQLILFLSIFYSPLYILIIKPHVITLLIVPYVIFYWFRNKDLSDYRVFRPIDSFKDFRIYNIFIDSFILQILNPILLPSPVLARLIHLFLFRYSNNVMFLMSSFLGWLVGHILFSNLSRLLLIRIQSDSPILYLLIKRIIYKTFSIIIFIYVLLYLGKAPVSLFTNKFEDRLILLDTNFRQLPDLMLWMFKPWPTSSFDQYKPNRPIRYIENSRFSGNSPVKRQVSNHFFNRCLTDGKERLTFAVLPSLSIFEKQFQFRESSKNLDGSLVIQYSYKDWIWDQSRKNKALNNELKNRIKSLDTKSIFLKTIERRTEFIDKNKGRLPRLYDPFLSNSYRVRTPISHSFWILCNLLELQTGDNNEYTGQSNYYNRIQDWISNRYQQLNCDKVPLPWETLPRSARRIFLFMFENSRDVRIQSIFKEMDLVYKENDPLSVTWQVTWEQVLKLPLAERALFFIYLKEDCNAFDWIDLLDIFSIHKERSSSLEQKSSSIYKIEELLKELTHNTHLIFNNRFDVVGGVTDIRNRKLKNLGITIGKTRLKTRKVMKRFSETSDFRRRLIKGSMRPRRRKILVWKLFQEKAHSPFFLRLIETPTLFQPSTREFINSERLIIDAEQETNVEFEQELSSSSSLKNNEGLHSSIAARWDTGPIHTGRGLLLVLQSNLRKYLKLPILITLKNFGRIFLFQVPEWNEDWNQWHKESHINCTYDGEEFSDTELPGRWLKEGLQIKIVHPFELKPWHTHKGKQSTVRGKRINLKKNQPQKLRKNNKLEQGEFKAAYLTIWGFQTDIPFGTIQKDPSFWKPIKRELIKTWKNSLSLGTRQINSFCSKLGIFTICRSSLWKDLNPFHRFKAIQENSNQTNGIGNSALPDMKTKYKKKDKPNIRETLKESIPIDNQSHSITNSDNRRVPDTLSGFKSETKFGIYQSNNMMIQKIDKDEPSIKPLHLNKVKIDRRLRNTDLTSSLRFKKQLVDIRRTILRFRISMAKFFDKYLPITIFFQRINRILYNYYVTLMTFQIQLVGVIRDIFENDAKIQESTLVIPNTGRKTLRIDDNQSMRSLSQAYIYENLWGISVRDSLDLNHLLEILKDSEDPKEPDNNEQLDEDSSKDDNKEEQNSEEYNDTLKNGNLPKKKSKYSKSIHDQNNREKEGLVECLDNRDKIIHKYIDKQIKDFTMAQGLFKQLLNLNVNDCKIWLECFDRYNLPLRVWRKIAPYKWRVNPENLNRLEEIERSYFERQDRYGSYKKQDDYSLYTKNPSFRDRIKNLNKRRKYNHLLYSFVDSLQDANIQGSLMWKNAMKQEIRCKNCIKKLITRKGKKSFHQRISNLESKLISKTDLVLWIIADLIETRNAYETRSKFVPKTSILQKNLFHYFPNGQFQRLSIDYGFEQRKIQSDEMLLRERTSHYFIFQWKWKSEALERELQKFKDLISLSSVLENKPDITALCINMGIDLDLLNLFFEKEKGEMLEDLFIVSAHRLSRILDDQILMYKMVSILLKFGNRFKRRLNRNILDGCKPRLSLINRREKERDWSYLYNVEDLLLSRRRRESRFLRSLGITKRVKCKEHLLDSTFQMQEGEESKDSSGTQRIKRFLWPSYRLEELACINRFCFNTSNGSRFAILKIRMYTII